MKLVTLKNGGQFKIENKDANALAKSLVDREVKEFLMVFTDDQIETIIRIDDISAVVSINNIA